MQIQKLMFSHSSTVCVCMCTCVCVQPNHQHNCVKLFLGTSEVWSSLNRSHGDGMMGIKTTFYRVQGILVWTVYMDRWVRVGGVSCHVITCPFSCILEKSLLTSISDYSHWRISEIKWVLIMRQAFCHQILTELCFYIIESSHKPADAWYKLDAPVSSLCRHVALSSLLWQMWVAFPHIRTQQ